MSLAEIEAELVNLSPEELRALALKTWSTFVQKEGPSNECIEDEPELLKALDDAVVQADSNPGQGHSASGLRERLGWPPSD